MKYFWAKPALGTKGSKRFHAWPEAGPGETQRPICNSMAEKPSKAHRAMASAPHNRCMRCTRRLGQAAEVKTKTGKVLGLRRMEPRLLIKPCNICDGAGLHRYTCPAYQTRDLIQGVPA